METERKLLKIPLGFRSKIPRRGIHEYQRPENFAKHNALCKRDENYGILMGKPNNAICLDYDIYDPNCKDKQKYTLEYFKKMCGDDVYISRTLNPGILDRNPKGIFNNFRSVSILYILLTENIFFT